MTIAFSAAVTGTSTANQFTTSGTVNFVAGQLYLILLAARNASGTPGIPAVSSPTFSPVIIGTPNQTGTVSSVTRGRAVYVIANATVSEVVTADWGAAVAAACIAVCPVSGMSASPFTQCATVVTGTTTTPTITLAAFADAVNNAAFIWSANSASSGTTGLTELVDITVLGAVRASLYAAYKIGQDLGPTFTIGSSAHVTGGFELAVAAAGGVGVKASADYHLAGMR